MNHSTVLAIILLASSLLAAWLMLSSSSARKIADCIEVGEELKRQLSNLTTRRTDLECLVCKAIVCTIQIEAKSKEEKLISDVTRSLCSIAGQWTGGLVSVCNGLVSEFRVSLTSFL